jgi:hypothetical protein
MSAPSAAATTARTCSAERTCGAITPVASTLSTRKIHPGARLGTRTKGVIPAPSAATPICPAWWSDIGQCSMPTVE